MKKSGILGVCVSLLLAFASVTTVHATELNDTVTTNEVVTQEITETNPIVILESYSIDTDNIVYGNEYNMHLTFRNESKYSDATEILVTYSSPNNTQYIAPTYGNVNNFYIEEIKKNATYEMDLPVCILSSKNGYVQMQFAITYTTDAKVHSTLISNITFRISLGGGYQAMYNDIEADTSYQYVNNGNQTSVNQSTGMEQISGSSQTGTTQNSSQNVSGQTGSKTGLDSTTIVMGVAVLVAILALFGLIFGRKKK